MKRATMPIGAWPFLLPLLLWPLAGCQENEPYARTDLWRPNAANAANLATMTVNPADLLTSRRGSPAADGQLAASAVDRLYHDRTRPLPDIGIGPMSSGGGHAASSGGPSN